MLRMIFSAFFLLMILSFTYVAPLSSRDEVENYHLLSIIQDKVSATYQHTALTKHMLYKLLEELSSKTKDWTFKASSPVSDTSKAGISFDDLALKFLLYELQPSIWKQQPCASKEEECMTTKKVAAYTTKLGSTVNGRVQGRKHSAYHLANSEEEIPKDRVRTIIFSDCLGAVSKEFAEDLKLDRNFGSQDSKAKLLSKFMGALAKTFFKYAESNNVLEAMQTFITSYVNLLKRADGGSAELVGNTQAILDFRSLIDFVKNTGKKLIGPTGRIISHLIKDKNSREVFRHFVDLTSALLNDEDSSALDPSMNFFLKLVDGTKLNDELKNELKKTIRNGLLILFKTLRGEDPSKEEKLILLDSTIRLVISRYNLGTEKTNTLVPLLLDQFDYFFTHGDVKRQFSPELQSLVFQLLQKVGKDVVNLNITDGHLKNSGLEKCVNGLLDGINTNFTDFPEVPNGRATSEEHKNYMLINPSREHALKSKFNVPPWIDLKYRKN